MTRADPSDALAVGAFSGSDGDAVLGFARAADRLTHWLRRATPGLTWGVVGFTTLDRLAGGGPHRITELAAAERVSQPGMTGLVARMAAAGLVERRRDPADGRAVLVTVTGSGRAYLDSVHQGRAELLARRVAVLAESDRAALFAATPVLQALVAGDGDALDGEELDGAR